MTLFMELLLWSWLTLLVLKMTGLIRYFPESWWEQRVSFRAFGMAFAGRWCINGSVGYLIRTIREDRIAKFHVMWNKGRPRPVFSFRGRS